MTASNIIFNQAYDTALKLAKGRIPVFPVEPNGKQPLTEHGFKDASFELHVLDRWHRAWPDANYAFEPEKAGLCVIDVDVKNQDGLATWEALQVERGYAPPTRTIKTPSGGLHLYFKGSLSPSTGKLGPGIDTRGRGSYVLLPGSVINGVAYSVETDCEPASLPDWIPELLNAPKAAVESEWHGIEDLPDNVNAAIAYLEQRAPAVEGAGGDEWTMGTAADLRKFGLSGPKIFELMRDHWNDRCAPPWELDGADSLETKVRAGCNHCETADQVGLHALDGKSLSETFDGYAPPTAPSEDDITREPSQKQRKKSPRFRPMQRKELRALRAPKFLYDKLLPENCTAQIVGHPGAGKSTVMLELAACACCGEPAFGTLKPSKTGAVIYIVGEGQQDFMTTRLAAWEKKHGVNLDNHPFYVLPEMPQVSAETEFEDTADWIAEVAGDIPVIMIIIDTQATATIGMEENGAKDMGRMSAVMATLHKLFDCAVVTVHHPAKGATGADIVSRGSGAPFGNIDTGLTVESGSKLRIDLTVRKQRGGEAGIVFPLKAEVVNVGTGAAFEMATALVPVMMTSAEVAEAKKDADTLYHKMIDGLVRRDAWEGGTTLTTNQLAVAIYECEDPTARAPDWQPDLSFDARRKAIQKQLTDAAARNRDFDRFRRRNAGGHWEWSLPQGWEGR